MKRNDIISHYKSFMGIEDMPLAEGDNLTIDWAEQLLTSNNAMFRRPTTKQLIEISILFNDGKVEQQKIADQLAVCQFVLNRLHENGDVTKKSSSEK